MSLTAELIGAKVRKKSYIIVARLPDGTTVNEVTIYTGPGVGTDTEIECDRPLTQEEIDAVLQLTGFTDVAQAARDKPIARPQRYPVQKRY